MEIQNNSAIKTLYGVNSAQDKKEDDNTSFQNYLNEKEETTITTQINNDNKTDKEVLQSMLDDIRSVLKTGHTVEEIEELEELLQEILKEMKNKNVTDKKIKELRVELEKAILEFKKDVTGVFIKEANDGSSISDIHNSIKDKDTLIMRVEEVTTVINELKANVETQKELPSSHENLKLFEELLET